MYLVLSCFSEYSYQLNNVYSGQVIEQLALVLSLSTKGITEGSPAAILL